MWGITLGEKKILDFVFFIFCPNMEQKTSRKLAIASQFLIFSLGKSRRSSAKNTWEKPGPPLEAFNFTQSSKSHFLSMRPKNSMHSRNKYGECGSPYQSPLKVKKESNLPPLTNREVEVEETQLIISLMMAIGKPKWRSTCLTKLHSNRS